MAWAASTMPPATRILALAHHRQALELATDLTQPADQARAHDGLAHAHHALNQPEQARQHWQHALNILTGIGADSANDDQASASTIRRHLADLNQQRDHPARVGLNR